MEEMAVQELQTREVLAQWVVRAASVALHLEAALPGKLF
jgi:hypothetical protein